jgi:hypothetical protein
MGNATVEKARVRKWQQLVGLAVLAVGWCGLGVYGMYKWLEERDRAKRRRDQVCAY